MHEESLKPGDLIVPIPGVYQTIVWEDDDVSDRIVAHVSREAPGLVLYVQGELVWALAEATEDARSHVHMRWVTKA